MATARKSKAATGKRKAASAARRAPPVKKAKAVTRKPAAAPAKGAGAGKGAAAARPAAEKRGRTAAAAGRTSSGRAGRPAAPPPVVRPLGVLPPEMVSRTRERHAAPPAAQARPAATPRKGPARTETAGSEPVTAKDYKHFEDLLQVELQKIRKEMGHLETTVLKVNPRDSSGDLSGYSFHMADAGTDAMEREKAFMFASVEGRKELEIRAALQRIYDGTYGVCENCGQPISRARLEAVPYVRLCVLCKQKEEQANRSQPG